MITTLPDGTEEQFWELVTVKLYVPDVSPGIVVVAADPVIEPGLIVQIPDGKAFNTTLPVTEVHVG